MDQIEKEKWEAAHKEKCERLKGMVGQWVTIDVQILDVYVDENGDVSSVWTDSDAVGQNEIFPGWINMP